MKERPAGTFPHSLSLLFGTRASDTSHSLLRARTMSSNNTTIEETERLLHPETRALLSSIHTTASQYRERTTTTTTTKSHAKFSTTPRNVVLGGIGVATVALGSYVSGYRSSSIAGLHDATTTTMRLGNEQQQQQQQQQQQHSKKVVLHTGCSPVAQVEKTRWLFFFVSHRRAPIPRPVSRLDDDDDYDHHLRFVQTTTTTTTTRSSFRKREKKTTSLFFFFFFFWT